MLGQPSTMLIPEVIGVKLTGRLAEGATATDLVLTVTEMLRKRGVVEKFVEFFGDGLGQLPLADRATIANMAPEYGATCGIFPIDEVTLDYLRLTGRDEAQIALVREYAKKQGMWRARRRAGRRSTPMCCSSTSGRCSPRWRARSARRTALRSATCRRPIREALRARPGQVEIGGFGARQGRRRGIRAEGRRGRHRCDHVLHQHLESGGHDRRGPCRPECAPARPRRAALGQDLARAGLEGRHRLPAALGTDWTISKRSAFILVGYGCTTCIGNSGPAQRADLDGDQRQQAVGRLGAVGQPQLRGPRAPGSAHELPRLAAARRRLCARGNRRHRPHARRARPRRGGQAGLPARHLADSPRGAAVRRPERQSADMFSKTYADVFHGDERWRGIQVPRVRRPTSGTAAAPTSRIRPTSTAWASKPPGLADGARRALPRAVRRLDHDRPYFSRGRHQEGFAGRPVPAEAAASCRPTSTATARAAATTK